MAEVTLPLFLELLIHKKEINRMEGTLLALCGTANIGREVLALVPAPPGTAGLGRSH